MTAAVVLYAQAALLLVVGGLAIAAVRWLAPTTIAAAPDRWRRTFLALLAATLVLPLGWRASRGGVSAAPVEILSLAPSGDSDQAAVLRLAAPPSRAGGARAATSVVPLGRSLAWAVALALGAGMAASLLRVARAERRLARHCLALPVVRRSGRVTVAACDRSAAPFAAAFGRHAFIVVPTAALGDQRRLRMVLAHEAHHLRAGHAAGWRVLALVQALFFWNPALALWRRAVRETEELACDARVVRRRGFDARAYASCLIWAAELPHRPRFVVASLMAAPSADALRRRIAMLLARPRVSDTRQLLLGLTCAAVVVAASFGGSVALADRPLEEVRARAAASITPQDGVPVVVDELVLEALERRLGTPEGRAATRRALARMPDYEPMMREVLARHGLPGELVGVVLVESGFRNGVRPDADGSRGVGLWQFIPATARRYGLVVEQLEDERLEPRRATEAAASHLAELHARFGEWPLAFAAYYQGADAVDKAIAKAGTRDAAELQRRELLSTYPSRVLAAVLLLRDPTLAS